MPPTLVLFAKFPVPGYAKTRLIPALGPRGAAQVHRHLTERTVATLLSSGAPVEIRFAGADEHAFRDWLGAEPAFAAQVEGGLSERLIDAGRTSPHIFFGADTPELTVEHVRAAVVALASHDIVIGPAEDGGYYLIGMTRARPELLTDMPWSTSGVLPETLRRCAALGLTVATLPVLSDCDTPADLARWPNLAALA
ncbi:TIGR04282 family arsenosugar biosynthesis glycosyltransferase [Blastomonas sp.]|uniref:TIGR04282 family arsenosugar biosynthesis glycosyltransferase n=1 Tax=Blastomonas sp. TaxID=1909299 RepID=UPI002639F5BF|nr:TIGR04282 family arsenosugar biosynthesis glycosyltransferase [Blastomonas sp.]MDM7954961.1 TIGR04282 family arsenosugar biosynthesis glycosyltransferase [Blastomonas sp.]